MNYSLQVAVDTRLDIIYEDDVDAAKLTIDEMTRELMGHYKFADYRFQDLWPCVAEWRRNK